jgi:hypothetical protein
VNLRETTKSFITLLEEKSGLPVHVREAPDLPTIATVRIARGNLPAHIISFKPGTKNETPDYAIIFQCAMAIRTFECPPDDRKLIAASAYGEGIVRGLLTTPNGIAEKLSLSSAQAAEYGERLLMGLVTHLRSVPISLRVSETLTLEHPELLEHEASQAERELRLNRESLAEHIREVTPRGIFDPTQAINAAFAIFWAERLERTEIANPYLLAGFEAQGQALLKILAEVPTHPVNDCELIDRWAEQLGIRDLYEWLAYHSP